MNSYGYKQIGINLGYKTFFNLNFKKVDPFCTLLLRSYTVSIHVHCMCLAESIN